MFEQIIGHFIIIEASFLGPSKGMVSSLNDIHGIIY